MKILVIPDTQVKPGVPIAHMKWAAKAVKDYLGKGDYVVHMGDHWDFPSLNYYSSRLQLESARVLEVAQYPYSFKRMPFSVILGAFLSSIK